MNGMHEWMNEKHMEEPSWTKFCHHWKCRLSTVWALWDLDKLEPPSVPSALSQIAQFLLKLLPAPPGASVACQSFPASFSHCSGCLPLTHWYFQTANIAWLLTPLLLWGQRADAVTYSLLNDHKFSSPGSRDWEFILCTFLIEILWQVNGIFTAMSQNGIHFRKQPQRYYISSLRAGTISVLLTIGLGT